MSVEAQVRFGPLRATPPAAVVRGVGGNGSPWRAERLGSDGPFPNGGMWRVLQPGTPGASAVVKRTGPAHLGGDPVWAGAVDPADPQWWGREAVFYRSDLATDGWTDGSRAARCLAIDDHDDVRDLWLEDVADLPLPSSEYRRLVGALARWQVHHRDADHPWLSHGWIAHHLGRRGLDNTRTLEDGRWSRLFDAGIPASVRDAVRRRLTDPTAIGRLLDELPQLLTHHDLHHMNLGRVGDEIVIIDWATVGPGPVGHDVGLLLVDRATGLGDGLPAEWEQLIATYTEALRAAGSELPVAEVERSVAISTVLRHGWVIDYVLARSDDLAPADLAALAPLLVHLARLQRRHLPQD